MLKEENENDEESQLTIATLYLQKFELGDTSESGFNAVNWLLKASRSGNEKATELLKKCSEKNIGEFLKIFINFRIIYSSN